MINFKKTFLLDLAIALILVGALTTGLVFFGSKINSSVDAITALRQDIINRSASLDLFASLRSQYNEQAKAHLNVLYNVIPTKDQLIDLPKDFQSLANQQKLGFGFSFVGETAPTGGALGSVTFRLNVQGTTLDQLFQFVQKLQNFRYISALDSFNLNRSDGNIQMAIVGRIFYR